jgi:hypothetical protein
MPSAVLNSVSVFGYQDRFQTDEVQEFEHMSGGIHHGESVTSLN